MAKKRLRSAATGVRHPKAVRKSVRSSPLKTIIFPIDSLPAELLHMICVYLKPTELANLRLVSRSIGPISLQYMVPEAHLINAKDSFEQLKALAEHPIASKYVTSFLFEADKLGILSRKHWEKIVAAPQYVAQVEEFHRRGHPCHHASERSLRTFKRDLCKMKGLPRHRFTEEQMDHAYEQYRDFIHFQHDPDQRALREKEIVDAMKHFPRLKKITMETYFCGRNWTSKLKKTFESAFCYQTDAQRDYQSEPLGVQQMRSLLLGAHHAGSKIETLQCGLISWRVFEQDTETFTRMKASISNVKSLALDFAIGSTDLHDPWTNLELGDCSSCLRAGRLRDFVAAAPGLETLQLSFQLSEPNFPAHLKYVVGEHRWPALRAVSFDMIATSEDDLVAFCSRHASSLKSLHLTTIWLDEGDWFSAFDRMRKVLTLETMDLAGRLGAEGEVLDFDTGSGEYCPRLQEGIEAYFRGPCAAEGEETWMGLDEFLDYYLPVTDDSMWSEVDSAGVYDPQFDMWSVGVVDV